MAMRLYLGPWVTLPFTCLYTIYLLAPPLCPFVVADVFVIYIGSHLFYHVTASVSCKVYDEHRQFLSGLYCVWRMLALQNCSNMPLCPWGLLSIPHVYTQLEISCSAMPGVEMDYEAWIQDWDYSQSMVTQGSTFWVPRWAII